MFRGCTEWPRELETYIRARQVRKGERRTQSGGIASHGEDEGEARGGQEEKRYEGWD